MIAILKTAALFPVKVAVAMVYLALYYLKLAAGLAVIIGSGYACAGIGWGLVYVCSLGSAPQLALFAVVPSFALGALGAVAVLDGPVRDITVVRGKLMKGSVKEDD
jgi:hypothetical protein